MKRNTLAKAAGLQSADTIDGREIVGAFCQ
jgi:hypothetical protein